MLFASAGNGGPLLMAGYALILVDAAAQSLAPAVFRVVLNRIQHDSREFLRTGWQTPALAAVVVATVFLTAAYFAHTWTRRGATRWANNLRQALYEHVQRLSVDFFHRARLGDIAGRINQDIERLESTLVQGMALWWAVALLLISVGLIAWVDLWMLALALALLAVAAGWTLLILPTLHRHTRDIRAELGRTAATLTELLGVHTLLKAFNAEEDALRRVHRGTDGVRDRTESLARLQHRYADTLGFHLAFVAPFVLLFAGAWRAASGTLGLGDIVAVWGFWLQGSGALSTGRTCGRSPSSRSATPWESSSRIPSCSAVPWPTTSGSANPPPPTTRSAPRSKRRTPGSSYAAGSTESTPRSANAAAPSPAGNASASPSPG